MYGQAALSSNLNCKKSSKKILVKNKVEMSSHEKKRKLDGPEVQFVPVHRWGDDVLVNYNRKRSGFFTTWETVQYYIRGSNFSNT